MKPFLVLQLRPEDDASDDEFHAILDKGRLESRRAHRVRLEREPLPADLSLDDYAAIIVGGGPGCVSDPADKKTSDESRAEAAIMGLMPEVTATDKPFLGCCYGIGILAHHLGGEVSKDRYSEPVGPVTCRITPDGKQDPLLKGLPEVFDALVGHKEAVQSLPPGAVHLMSSEPCPYQMLRFRENVYSTQFHPEADAEVFAERIRIYGGHGYFEPEEAAELTDACHAANVMFPKEILRRFVARFG
ncbi:MAG: glutamine amidotransferase [Boseongicola sp.]